MAALTVHIQRAHCNFKLPIARRYVKWVLGLDRNTPNYIILEETKMLDMKVKASRKAIAYEEKARKSNKMLLIECIREKEKVGRPGQNGKGVKLEKRWWKN